MRYEEMKIEDERVQVQLCNKPISEMELLELYAERSVHQWHATKMDSALFAIRRKLWWQEQNMPIPTPEELKAKYENGEFSKTQYGSAMAGRKRTIAARMRVKDKIEYAEMVITDQKAIVAYIDEVIAVKTAIQEDRALHSIGNPKLDPRKPGNLNSQRRWKTRQEKKKMPHIQGASVKLKTYRAIDADAASAMKRLQAITTWDADKLKLIARDRGYYTDIALTAVIAETLRTTVQTANKMIDKGKFSWGQCLVIGGLFEMTPKEFCDVFLSGYFKEIADGVYKAHVDDVEALLDTPYKSKVVIREGATDGNEQDVQADMQGVSD